MSRLNYNAAAPDGMKALGGVSQYIAQSGLPKELVDLVYLRVSQINGCAYCVDMHTRDALKGGMNPDKATLVVAWREAGSWFTEKERAALGWAESLTLISQTHVPDADYAPAREQFSEKELTDLTIAVGLMNAYNRIAVGFHQVPAQRSA